MIGKILFEGVAFNVIRRRSYGIIIFVEMNCNGIRSVGKGFFGTKVGSFVIAAFFSGFIVVSNVLKGIFVLGSGSFRMSTWGHLFGHFDLLLLRSLIFGILFVDGIVIFKIDVSVLGADNLFDFIPEGFETWNAFFEWYELVGA